MVTKTCAKAAIETVSLQYDGISILNCEHKNEVSEIPNIKLQDRLLSCPEFGPFFQSLESKDKRLFMNMCQFVDVPSGTKVISEYSPANSIILILAGELMGITKAGISTNYKTGEMIGIREVFFDLCWKENIYGRFPGCIVKIRKDYFNDLGHTFVKSAGHFFEFFVKTECLKITKKYSDAKHMNPGNSLLGGLDMEDEDLGMNEKGKQVCRFVELNIDKKTKAVKQVSSTKEDEIELFRPSSTFPPLMLISAYKSIVAQDKAAEKATKKDEKRDLDRKGNPTIFLKEKLEHQLEERRRKEKDIRMRKKKGLPYEELLQSNNAAGNQKGLPAPTLEALENEYEKLKNDFTMRELSRDRVNEEHEKLLSKLEKMEQEVKMLKEKNIFITAERDRLKLHKELLGKIKDGEDGESYLAKISKGKQTHRNFNDVVEFI